jgi:beta-phosphoglucomutase
MTVANTTTEPETINWKISLNTTSMIPDRRCSIMTTMSDAIIFDFDGVIVSSEQSRFQALQKIALRFDVEIPDKLFTDIIGRTTKDFFSEFLPNIDPGHLSKIMQTYQKEYKNKIIDFITPIHATIDFIQAYDGTKLLAVASGSDTVILETVLKHLGIYDKFACIVGKEHVTKHKPDPEVYAYTATQLGCDPGNCVVVEDTVVGVQAALHAGMKVYVFLNEVNSKEEFAGIEINGFLETTEHIRQSLQ